MASYSVRKMDCAKIAYRRGGLQAVKALGAMLLLVATISMSAYMATNKALLQFKDSERAFWLSPKAAVLFHGEGRFNAAACTSDDIYSDLHLFTDTHRQFLCRAFASSGTKSYVETIVLKQRVFLLPIVIFLGFVTWTLWASTLQDLAAYKMRERLLERRSSTIKTGRGDLPARAETREGTVPAQCYGRDSYRASEVSPRFA